MTDAELLERRQKADAVLWSALMEHADAYYLSEDGEILSEYAIVAYWEPANPDDDGSYTLHVHTPQATRHATKGLLGEGIALADHTL